MTTAPEPFFPDVLPRRSPFGDNPRVGAGGTRTQQRILRAALEVFGQYGYHDCGVDRITAQAECSRPTFYQYFSSKEDLFRSLAGELSRRLFDVSGQPGLIGADLAGWGRLRTMVSDYGAVFDEYSPVFAVFSTAQAADDAVASGSVRVFHRIEANVVERLDPKGLRHREPELVLAIMLDMLARAQRFRQTLFLADWTPIDRERIDDSLTDVVHRTLFGQRPGINVRSFVAPSTDGPPPSRPAWRVGPGEVRPAGAAARRTRTRLLQAGRQVFASHGFHEARVDDIVERAETSHGTFYRYFESKDALFRLLAARSGLVVVDAVERLIATIETGDAVAAPMIRSWLRTYFDAYAVEQPVIRAWVEAIGTDDTLRDLSRQEVESLRGRLARFLAPRRFGDIDADALVLMALLDRSHPFSAPDGPAERAVVDGFTKVIQHGFLIVP